MSLYLDTSCALKLLWPEPETARTVALVEGEDHAVVSDLTWLEIKVRVQGRHAAGLLSRPGARSLVAHAESLFATPPFERRSIPPQAVDAATAQVTVTDKRGHCRTLDRLHLAALRTLGLSRLLTNDDAQAAAARALGVTVLLPR